MQSMTIDLLLVLMIGGVHASFWGILLGNLWSLRRNPRPSPASLPSLSVCIPARNEAENLRRLLPTLTSQQYLEFEVLVWDDDSDDETWDVLETVDDPRITALRGSGPPSGWVGKVHALYQCTRRASGECYLFLDADAELRGPLALRKLVERHTVHSTGVSSGLTALKGGALLLVSLVPHVILKTLPWPLVTRTDRPSLSALNGQCWLIDSTVYHTHEPHRAVNDAVLEDVAIGRYLKRQGHPPDLLDVQDLVNVHMYTNLGEAWCGFRKNAYLLLGGTVPRFCFGYAALLTVWFLAVFVSVWFLFSLYGLKFVTDRASGMPPYVSALAPLSFVFGLALALDSAIHHWTNHVTWKGRPVSTPGHVSRHR